MRIHLLALALLLPLSQAALERPKVSLQDIEKLRLKFTLQQLFSSFEERTTYVQELFRQRRWKIVRAYYRFHTTRRVLALISVEATNLRRIYELREQLVQEGTVSDVELLLSHNSYLGKESSRISKREECRALLLQLVELCCLELEVRSDGEEAQGIEASH